MRQKQMLERLLLLGLIAAGAAAFAFADKYYIFLLSLTAATAIAAIGLNILIGLSGQVSLGHAAFYAIGAYAAGLLTTELGLSFWLALPIAGLISGLAGLALAIPALRAAGPYLAMLTIAFGFIVEQGLAEWKGLTGGWNGLSGIDMPSFFGGELHERSFGYVVFAGLLLALWFFSRLRAGAWGLAMGAVRDAPAAAQSVGLNTVRVRTLAFILSAMLTGMAGGLFAVLNSFISPESFPFFQSITFLLIVMIGGAGTVGGPFLGALVVVLVPELLSSLAQYRVLVMGALFLVVLRLAPGGIASLLQAFLPSMKQGKPQEKAGEISTAVTLPMRAATAPLTVENLDVHFGGVHAVKSLSFEALPNQITSIVGPNGAGKSTVVNLICGFYQPTSGSVRLGTQLLTGLSPNRIARNGVLRTFQTTQLFAHLTVLDNILIGMRGGNLSVTALIAAEATEAKKVAALSLLSLVGFDGDPYQMAGALPHGVRRLVEIARALAAKPAVLLLDEPAAGLDAVDTEKLGTLLKAIAASGIAVILIEHDMDLVMSVSNRVVVLDAGQKIAEGPPAEVMANTEVQKAYLGEGYTLHRAEAPRAPSSRVLLTTKGVSSGYGEIPVLRDITLDVKEGETIAILGPNGAGKTTLLRTLAGLNRCTSGTIEFAGRHAEKLPAEERARLGLVLVPEGRQVFPELNVFENLMLGGINLPRAEAEARAEELLSRFPRLVERRHQRAGLLSGGEQQMLAIARGLMSKPKILMLDEPSLGLAPLIVDEVYAWLAALKQEGLTILIADQLAPLALSIADRAYVLQRGKVQFEGEAAKLAADPALLRAFLGETVAA